MNYKIRKEYECRNSPHENINALNHGIRITKSHSFGFLFNQNLALESFALVISSGFCLNRIHRVVCFTIVCGSMMTSSNGNIFRVTGPLCGEFTGPGEFPTQRPVTRGFDVFVDLRLYKRLSKQPWGWWFETPSWSLWHHCNAEYVPVYCLPYAKLTLNNQRIQNLNVRKNYSKRWFK